MSMYVPEDAQGHSSPQPAAPLQAHGGTGTNKKRNPLWSWRSIEQKVHDAREDSVDDAGAIEILRSEGVADPEAALATYAIQRPVRVGVPPYDHKRASYLAATRIRLEIKEGTLWEHSDITQALKKVDLWETLQDHYGLESYGIISYRWDSDVVEALERYIGDPRRVPADLAGPTSAKPLTADAAAAIRQREELARLRADEAELGEIITESFLGALSYGERLYWTDDPHDLLEAARLGAIAEGVVAAAGLLVGNRGTYSPKVVDPAPIEPSGPVSPRGNPPTPPRPSELREKAEAGKRMLDRAEERLQKVVTDKAAGERVAATEDALRRAQADIDTRQQAGKGPTKPQLSKLESARNKLAQAQTKQAAAIETARNKVDEARQLAATRAATYERAKADAAQRAAQRVANRTAQEEMDQQWDVGRPEAWKKLAQDVIEARKAGTSSPPLSQAEYDAQLEAEAAAQAPIDKNQPIDWPDKSQGARRLPPGAVQELNPIEGMTNAELADVARTGKLPDRLKGLAELEHRRIVQRVGNWLAKSGIPPDVAASLTKKTDLSNLDPASPTWHATVDEYRAKFRKGYDPKDPMSSLDTRVEHPLEALSDAELADILAAVKKYGAKLDLPIKLGTKNATLGHVLSDEMAKRPAFKGQVL